MVAVIDHAFATLSQYTPKLFQTRYIALGTAAVDDGMGVSEKFGQVYGNTAQLVNAVAAVFRSDCLSISSKNQAAICQLSSSCPSKPSGP